MIWGLAGGFFGAVYLAFARYLEYAHASPWRVLIAAAVAGGVVATFYSAKRTGLVGAATGSLTSLALLVSADSAVAPWTLAAIAGAAGVVAGIPAAWIFERRRGAMVLAATGLLVGLAGGTMVAILAHLVPALNTPFLTVLLLVPSCGSLYVLAVLRMSHRWSGVVPHVPGIALVSGGVSAVVAMGMWTLAAPLRLDLPPDLVTAMAAMHGEMPAALAGGFLGGAVNGALLQVLGTPWILGARPGESRRHRGEVSCIR